MNSTFIKINYNVQSMIDDQTLTFKLSRVTQIKSLVTQTFDIVIISVVHDLQQFQTNITPIQFKLFFELSTLTKLTYSMLLEW